jgi:uroporphyrin-3 C-methyltransferase
MSENENNDTEIVEGETLASETSAVQSESSPTQKSSKLAVSLALLSLLLGIAVIAGGAYFYKENKLLTAGQQSEISKLNKQLAVQQEILQQASQKTEALQSGLKTRVEQVNLQLQQANNASKLLQTDIQALQRAFAETKVRHPNDWILAEVEYLVKLAGRKIWLEKDVGSAVELLLAADQRVAELSDASLSVLRSALLEDINTLEALPKRDPDGVVLALSALERRIDKLVISGLVVPEEAVQQQEKLSGDINDWKKNLAKSWSDFVASFIVINKRESKLEALLSPEQRWYLQENVRHDLAKAEFAVYREQQDLYRQALDSAADMLKNYYDLDDSATRQFYQAVQKLAGREISTDYPDQLKSAPLLERIIEQRVKKSLASSRAEQE